MIGEAACISVDESVAADILDRKLGCIHFEVLLCGVLVGIVAIHLISVRFNGKLAISGTDLCHNAALVRGGLERFSERFYVHLLATAQLLRWWLGTHLVLDDSEKW